MKTASLLFLILTLASCSTTRKAQGDDGRISVQFLQINDVYEIAPVSNGREGGMARVATLKKQLQVQNPNTFLYIAGDFVSPSIFNSLTYHGKPIRGRQMVESLNSAGCDLAVFGNHEFDIKDDELQERLNESAFGYISGNAFEGNHPFRQRGQDIPRYRIFTVQDADGTKARIGIIGVVLPSNPASYVRYEEPMKAAVETYNLIKDSVDAVVALTHQTIEADMELARTLPGLAAIIGGHEHDQRFEKVRGIPITKALSNARSAFLVTLDLQPRKHKVSTKTHLYPIDESIALDAGTTMAVNHWMGIADSTYRSLGFNPKEIVISQGEDLNGREADVRSRSTNFTELVIRSMASAAPDAQIALFNSGSIRVDDIVKVPVSQYDLIRSLPFGGGIREFSTNGAFLAKVLEAGRLNRGSGGFLHYNDQLRYDETGASWLLNNAPLDPHKIYRVVTNDFLLTGRETNLAFLQEGSPEITRLTPAATAPDIRLVMIKYLKQTSN